MGTNQEGTNEVANYFFCRSTFNSSIVGWAGHRNSNFLSNEDVAQILEMVRNHKSKTISIDNVLLRRANFPLNCYTLDLLDDLDMKREKIWMVTLVSRSRGNSTFVFLKGQSAMDSDRDIPDHVFHRTYIQSERKVTKKYALEDWSERDYICGKWSNKKNARNIWTQTLQVTKIVMNGSWEKYAIKKVFSQSSLNDFEKVTKQKIITKSGEV